MKIRLRPVATPARAAQDGYILVAVLAVMLLLAGLVAAGSVMVRSALGGARLADDDIAMNDLLGSGLEITGYELGVLRLPAKSVSGRQIKLTGGSVTPTVIDESGKVDINGADPALLRSTLESVGIDSGAAADAVAAIVAARGPTGADSSAIAAASPSAAAAAPKADGHKRRGLESVSDLASLPDLTAADLRALGPRLTVYNPDGRIDILTADEAVLSAIPGLTKPVIADLLARRDTMSAADVRGMYTAFGSAKPFIKTDSGPAYSVRLDAVSSHGRRKVAYAVIAPSKSPNVPFYVLHWRD